MKWRLALAANRFKLKIRTVTRLSCSSLLAIEDLKATGLTSQRVFVDMRPQKLRIGLCQNCVTYPLKPRAHTVIYGDTPAHIVVAESRWWELR